MSHNHVQCGCVHSSMPLLHIMASQPLPLFVCILAGDSYRKRVSCVSDVTVLVFVTDTLEDGDQTKLVVGVVVGLLVATVVIGLAYFVYMKKSK